MFDSLNLSGTGIWAAIARGDQSQVASDAMKAAATQALTEWAQGKNGAKMPLPLRFTADGKRALGLSNRSPAYMALIARQQGGRYVPYRSPRRGLNWGELALALATFAGNPRAIQQLMMTAAKVVSRSAGAHMADVITTPGGFRVRASGGRRVRVNLTLPAARVLNRVQGEAGVRYRSELIGWERPQARPGAVWIMNRTGRLFWIELDNRLRRQAPARVA